jgi:type III secretion system low calcium response chaperone LcrH/SycD
MKGSRGTKGEMKKDIDQVSKDLMKRFESSFTDFVEKILKKKMLPKDAAGLSNNAVEGLYAQAYRLYNTGKYIEAVHLFRMLIMLNPTESKYVLGMAACFHMLKEYKNAIHTYTMCSLLDPDTPIPYYHSSDCFIQMKDYLSAMFCLELAIQKAGDKPQFAKVKERALMSLESIKKQQKALEAE